MNFFPERVSLEKMFNEEAKLLTRLAHEIKDKQTNGQCPSFVAKRAKKDNEDLFLWLFHE